MDRREPVVRRRVLAALAEATLAQAVAVAVTAAVWEAEPPGLGQPALPAVVVVHPSVARQDRAASAGAAPVGSLCSGAATTPAMWVTNTV